MSLFLFLMHQGKTIMWTRHVASKKLQKLRTLSKVRATPPGTQLKQNF